MTRRAARSAKVHFERIASQIENDHERDKRDALLVALFDARDLSRGESELTLEAIRSILAGMGFCYDSTKAMRDAYYYATGKTEKA
jgi:hypothetical protein